MTLASSVKVQSFHNIHCVVIVTILYVQFAFKLYVVCRYVLESGAGETGSTHEATGSESASVQEPVVNGTEEDNASQKEAARVEDVQLQEASGEEEKQETVTADDQTEVAKDEKGKYCILARAGSESNELFRLTWR